MIRKVNDAAGFVISMEMNSEVGNVGAIVQGGGNVGDGQVPDQGEQRPDEGDSTKENSDESGYPEDNAYLEVERDENGNLIHTVEMDEQGNQVERFYRPDGSCMRELVICTDGMQYEYIFDENEKRVSTTETHPDGMTVVTMFRPDGTRETEGLMMYISLILR